MSGYSMNHYERLWEIFDMDLIGMGIREIAQIYEVSEWQAARWRGQARAAEENGTWHKLRKKYQGDNNEGF